MLSDLARVGLDKMKSAGNRTTGYFDDGSRIDRTPVPDTPFEKALQVVDRRDGYAILLMKTWRLIAFATSVATVVATSGWWWETQKSQVEWLVVPIDKFGEPGEISSPAIFHPTDAQLAERAEQVVKAAFSISIDPKVNEANYEFLRNTLYGDAIAAWAEWWKQTKDEQPTERVIRIITVKPSAAGARTINIVWSEQDIKAGVRSGPARRVNGDLTLEYRKPKTRADAQRNKLGLWVTGFRFAPETR